MNRSRLHMNTEQVESVHSLAGEGISVYAYTERQCACAAAVHVPAAPYSKTPAVGKASLFMHQCHDSTQSVLTFVQAVLQPVQMLHRPTGPTDPLPPRQHLVLRNTEKHTASVKAWP
jgi:hypothetical protein